MGKPLGDRFTWKPGDIEVTHSICGFCKFYDTCESELKNNRIEALRCENLILDNGEKPDTLFIYNKIKQNERK